MKEVLDLLDDLSDFGVVCDCPLVQEVMDAWIYRFRKANPTREDVEKKDFKGVSVFEAKKKLCDWTGQTLTALKKLAKRDANLVDRVNEILETYVPNGWSDTEVTDSESCSSGEDEEMKPEQDGQPLLTASQERSPSPPPFPTSPLTASQERSPSPPPFPTSPVAAEEDKEVDAAVAVAKDTEKSRPYTLDRAKGRMILQSGDPDKIDWDNIVATLIGLGEGREQEVAEEEEEEEEEEKGSQK